MVQNILLFAAILIKVITAQQLPNYQQETIVKSSQFNPACCRELSSAIQDFVLKNLRTNAYKTPFFGRFSGPIIDDIESALSSCPRCSSVNVLPKAFSTVVTQKASVVSKSSAPKCSCRQSEVLSEAAANKGQPVVLKSTNPNSCSCNIPNGINPNNCGCGAPTVFLNSAYPKPCSSGELLTVLKSTSGNFPYGVQVLNSIPYKSCGCVDPKSCTCNVISSKNCGCADPNSCTCNVIPSKNCGCADPNGCTCNVISSKTCGCVDPNRCTCNVIPTKSCGCADPNSCTCNVISSKNYGCVDPNSCTCNVIPSKNCGCVDPNSCTCNVIPSKTCGCDPNNCRCNVVAPKNCGCADPNSCSCNGETGILNPNIYSALIQSGLLKVATPSTCPYCASPVFLNDAALYDYSCSPSGLKPSNPVVPPCSCSVASNGVVNTCNSCSNSNSIILNSADNVVYTLANIGCGYARNVLN